MEDYFDESFTKDTGIVRTLSDEYNRTIQNLLNILLQIESTEKANADTKLDIETFSAYLKTASSQFISNNGLSTLSKLNLNNYVKDMWQEKQNA